LTRSKASLSSTTDAVPRSVAVHSGSPRSLFSIDIATDGFVRMSASFRPLVAIHTLPSS
jgi:hypothetical protein